MKNCIYVKHIKSILNKNEVPYPAVCNKMDLDSIPNELRNFKETEKVSKRILFKKITIMHGKGEFSKIKQSICNFPIETVNICNILPWPEVSDGLIVGMLNGILNTGFMHISNQFLQILHTKRPLV